MKNITVNTHGESAAMISDAQYKESRRLFDTAQEETGGRVICLSTTVQGGKVSIHVGRWSHDTRGRLIIGENWHVSTPAAREPEHPGPFAEVDEDDPDRWEAEYNAKLNAAAPQMKEVCNLVVRRGMEQPSTAGARLTQDDWLLARSVVATAEGRAE